MTKLSELFSLLHIPCDDDRIIQGISDHTNDIEKDWLFVCRKGFQQDGTKFIQEALDKGAVILCEESNFVKKHVYYTKHIERICQALLELYYGNLCEHLKVIGITGTNGKTSVADFLVQLLQMQDCKVLRIGTGKIYFPNECILIENTTPGSFQLANYFRRAIKENISYVVMEVSSHAIDQNRINFLRFDQIIYTNITQDLLDYHITQVHYRFTKYKLRRYVKEKGIILYNNDIAYMQELRYLVKDNCIGIGKDAEIKIYDICLSDRDLSFFLQGHTVSAPLLGKVNVYNLAQAIVSAHYLGYSYEDLCRDCKTIQSVSGRMEIIQTKDFVIWVDYAHTASAVKELLMFANMVCKGRVIIVLGCGGERDRNKRPIMAEIAAEYSHYAVFTSDNPRGESISAILDDMLVKHYAHTMIFENRYFAIKHTIKVAQKNDIIIIAGKGDEDTMTVFNKKYPFSDKIVVMECLAKEELLWK